MMSLMIQSTFNVLMQAAFEYELYGYIVEAIPYSINYSPPNGYKERREETKDTALR